MVSSGIRIAGLGGQGVILAAMLIGKAAAIHDGKFATLTQSFGPEARGSAAVKTFSPPGTRTRQISAGNVPRMLPRQKRRTPETGNRKRFPVLVFGPRIPGPCPE